MLKESNSWTRLCIDGNKYPTATLWTLGSCCVRGSVHIKAAVVLPRLDYCDMLYVGLPVKVVQNVQLMQAKS